MIKSQSFFVPYGKTTLSFAAPAGVRGTLVHSNKLDPLEDVQHAISASLAAPIGAPPLRAQAGPGDRACIVFTDITRACPEYLLVPALLRELEEAGLRDEDITLLCGIGMHRPSTIEEKIFKLGASVVERYRVIDNEPGNARALVDLGVTPGGVPVSCHRSAVEADLLIATGIVEPHQYAGYSGGRKTLAVGAAGEALIAHTHGPAFIDDPDVRLGKIEGNPFHEAITEAARRAGLDFIINVVLDDDQRILKVAAGHPEKAFDSLVSFARGVYEVPIDSQFDVAVAGVGYPKDANLYQASRAASYLFFGPSPVVREGGVIIIPARCDEGAGAGVGEQRFFSAMKESGSIQAILDDGRKLGYPPGQQRAFVMAKVLEKVAVIVVGSQCPDIVEACKMIPAETMEEALLIAGTKVGADYDLLVVPHALLTLPVLSQSS